MAKRQKTIRKVSTLRSRRQTVRHQIQRTRRQTKKVLHELSDIFE
jgi:uncharacterized membrane protein